MAKYIEMPKLADTMTEGTLVRWTVKEGDKVKNGQEIAEIQTDKSLMGFESLDDGVIHKLLVEAGQSVPCGAPIAFLLGKNEEAPKELPPVTGGGGKPAAAPAAPAATGTTPAAGPVSATALPTRSALSKGPSGRVKASPLAKKIADATGVMLSRVTGTGPGGRVVARDVEAAAAAPAAGSGGGSSVPTIPATPAGPKDTKIPLSGMRRVISERLLSSKTHIPHFYLSIEMDAAPLMRLRAEANASAESTGAPKLTVNDFVLKGVVAAAQKVPAVNSAFAGDAIIQYASVNLCVAIAVEDGLVTPVIRDAQDKTIREISEMVKDLASRARAKKLKPEEFVGGTITVSNLGAYGIEQFCAIINPPQATILAIGSITTKPVVEDGKIAVGQRMTITLSGDHRVVDGAVGATYLAELKKLIENPALMLL